MFCENCGKPLGENAKFCTECGAKNPVPEVPVVETPAAEPTVAEVPAAEPTAAPISFGMPEDPKPKKKGGKKLLAVAILAVVLAAAVAVTAIASPFVGNLIAKTFRSPEGYLSYVMHSGTENFTEEFAAQLALMRNPAALSGNGTVDMHFTMGDGMKNLLKETVGSEAEMITSWVNSVGLGMDVAVDSGLIGLDADLSLNDTDLLSGSFAIDESSGMLYVTIPEISETGIGLPLDEYSDTMGSQAEMVELMNQMMEILPEEDALVELVCRYMDIVTAQAGDVEKDTETLEAGGVSQKVTVLTVEISEKTAMDIAEAVCREAKNDKEIKKIIERAAGIEEFGMDTETAYAEFQAGIESFLEEVDSYDASRETVCELKVYVNGRGEIIGLGAEIEEEATEISFCTVEKGSKTGAALRVSAPGTAVVFEGSGEIDGGKRSGTYDLTYNDMKLATVALSDIDDAKLGEGMLDGKISVSLSDGLQNMLGMYDAEMAALLKDARLDMQFTQSNASDAGVELSLYTGETLFASLTTEVTADGDGTVQLPATYISGEDEQELEAWLANSGFSPADLVNKLRAAGMPENLASLLEGTMNPAAEPEGIVLPGGDGTGIVDPRAQDPLAYMAG